MRAVPEDLDESDLMSSLSDGWGLDVVGIEYVAVGGGSYHWRVDDDAGIRHWVTADDLDQKGFLAETRDCAFNGLRCALDTALALRESDLEFVVAPVPTLGGETVRRLGTRHAVAVYPFVEGRSGQFGSRLTPAERAELVDMLVRLHRATPSAATVARPVKPHVPSRGGLEQALRDLDREWVGGPFSEPARAVVASHQEGIRRLLETFDRLADQVLAAGATSVITHGEPHPGNVVIAGDRILLVDWDTVGLAPPERDLWMLHTSTGDELMRYAEESGRQLNEAAIRLYRLRWQLDDIASFLNWFRSAHRQTADTEHAWRGFAHSIESDGVWPHARE
jgi:spectinomycin phosphotransferase